MIFHLGARVVDAWLAARRFAGGWRGVRERLGGAWRAAPGDLMALLVLRGCGVPVATGRTVRSADGTSGILVADPRTARYLDHARIPISAQTLGRYVLARADLPPELVEHELEHVRQWQRFGPFFLPAYLASSGLAVVRRRDAYWANAFEERARAVAARGTHAARQPAEWPA